MALVDTILSAGSPEELQPAWELFFLNKKAVAEALERPRDDISALLAKGALVNQTQHTTTSIAKRLQQLVGTVYVAGAWQDYNVAFMYSVALAAEVDPGLVQLTERQAEVAFALADCWCTSTSTPPGAAAGLRGGATDMATDNDVGAQATNEEEEEGAPLSWEDSREPLPTDLSQVSVRHAAGLLQVDARAWLEEMPRWQGMKDRPEVNNHRGDKEKQLDKVLRGLQAKVLGLQRMFPCLHSEVESEEGQVLGQKFWALLLDFDKSLVNQRKAASLPNTVMGAEPVLFSTEDLKTEKQHIEINKMGSKGYGGPSGGTSAAGSPHCPPPYLFRPTGKGFKFKSWKGGRGGYRSAAAGGGSYRAAPSWKGKSVKGGKPGKARAWCPGPAAKVGTHSGPSLRKAQHPQWAGARPGAGGHHPRVPATFGSARLPTQSQGAGQGTLLHCISYGESDGLRLRPARSARGPQGRPPLGAVGGTPQRAPVPLAESFSW